MKHFWISCLLVTCGHSWGPDGHRIVAEVAERLLAPTASRSVSRILNGSSMASVATWADEIDHTPEFAWTKCMHYIDSSIGVCSVSTETDCAKGCCVVKAIANYTSQIVENSNGVIEALKFLIHFMGDVHQPLHAGHREDKGGNMIEVVPEFSNSRKRENLHEVWDGVLIKHYLDGSGFFGVDGWKSFVEEIVEKIHAGDYQDEDTQACRDADQGEACALSAAQESAANACENAYINEKDQSVKPGDHLSNAYYSTRIIVIEKRLALAGIRLSGILNAIFPKDLELESIKVEIE